MPPDLGDFFFFFHFFFFSGLFAGAEGSAYKQEDEAEYLNVLYDPCLNCYFDPKTGKYYELA